MLGTLRVKRVKTVCLDCILEIIIGLFTHVAM